MVTKLQVNIGLIALLGAGVIAMILAPSLPMAAMFIVASGAYALWVRSLYDRGAV